MEFFNAFQLILAFAAGPFGIAYVEKTDFYAHNVLLWVLIVGYIIGFAALTITVAENLGKK